jgi:hypothetical protein
MDQIKYEFKISRETKNDDNIKMGLEEIMCEVWTVFVWLRTGFCDGLL